MKIFVLILITLLLGINSFSQNNNTKPSNNYIFESFENANFPPSGWSAKTPTGGTGWNKLSEGYPFPGWIFYANPAPLWGGFSYAAVSWNTGNITIPNAPEPCPGYPNDQWLISPVISINTGDSLKFRLLCVNDYTLDSLDVVLSSTNDSLINFTDTLITLVSTNFTSPTTWYSYSIDLSAYSGNNVYIAFREHIANNCEDGSGFGLDLVSVGTPQAIDVAVNTIDIKPITSPGFVIPKATFVNIGSNTQSFSATMTITPGSYSSTKTISSLISGTTCQITFDTLFTVNNINYKVFVTTSLAGDVNIANNSDSACSMCFVPDPILYDNRSYYPILLYSVPSAKYGGSPNGQNLCNVADDFIVPLSASWTITCIKSTGFTYTNSNIDRYGIYIYNDNNGRPGTILYSDSLSIPCKCNNADTSQTLILNNPFTLTAGKYWLSVFGIYDTATLSSNAGWNWMLGGNIKGDSCQIQNTSNQYGGSFNWKSILMYGATNGKSAFFTIHGTIISNINNSSESKSIIYPNPSNGIINIANSENSNVIVYNLLGEVVANSYCNSAFGSVDLSNLSNGSYIIKVISDKNIVTQKIDIIK